MTVNRAMVPVLGALVLAFAGMAVVGGNLAFGRLLFVAAAVSALTATAITPAAVGASLANRNVMAAVGATLAMAGVSIYGATEVTAVNSSDWEGLSAFVATTCGLATIWWNGHTRFTDHLRWIPSLVGAGWCALATLVFISFADEATVTDSSAGALLTGPTRGGTTIALCYGAAALLTGLASLFVLVGAVVGVAGQRRR